MIGRREVEGFPALTLASPGDDGVELAYLPGAGMLGCSLRHRGEELLGQRGGPGAYVAARSTMGIPLLHPWANRVAERRIAIGGREIDLDAHPELLSLDPNGLPIHGLLAAAAGWRVERHEDRRDGGLLEAAFDFGAEAKLMDAFPFPHLLRMGVAVSAGTATVETSVHASGDVAVPIAFGYHPYFRLPGVERSAWQVEVPVAERLELDERMLPNGRREPAAVAPGPLGARTFDDSYPAPDASRPFVLAGGGRRIEVSFGSGYPFAQVYAPADDDVIAFEPMTAPANALVSDGPELTMLPPGETYRATFSIAVSG